MPRDISPGLARQRAVQLGHDPLNRNDPGRSVRAAQHARPPYALEEEIRDEREWNDVLTLTCKNCERDTPRDKNPRDWAPLWVALLEDPIETLVITYRRCHTIAATMKAEVDTDATWLGGHHIASSRACFNRASRRTNVSSVLFGNVDPEVISIGAGEDLAVKSERATDVTRVRVVGHTK